MDERKVLFAPYEGNDPFIFVSYSHKNRDEALSIVERLQEDGYRVWYDEGIHPGSEWDEYIARYVANCSLFLALLSDEYLQSSNCKDELNHARNKEKNRVLVYLKDIDLPAGMELRLSRLQNIHRSNYLDENAFFGKLYTSDGIEACRAVIENKDEQHNNKESLSENIEISREMQSASVKLDDSHNQYDSWRDEDQQSIDIVIPHSQYVPVGKKTGDSSVKSEKRSNSKKKPVTQEKIYYFGANRVKKKYSNSVPDVIMVPEKTNIVLSDAFHNCLRFGPKTKNVRKIVLSDQVREIQEHAFRGLVIQETIVIPDSVVKIGEDAFQLGENAYVVCSIGSKAYSYCIQHGLKNTVDFAIWKKYGKCQYCGGDFTFLFKKCKSCGRVKDY